MTPSARWAWDSGSRPESALPEGIWLVVLGIVVPLVTPATLIWAVRRRRALRTLCIKCDVQREEPADRAAYLSAGQRVEEELGRIRYDLLVCPSCGDVRKSGAPGEEAQAWRCDACNHYTVVEGEGGELCMHCGAAR